MEQWPTEQAEIDTQGMTKIKSQSGRSVDIFVAIRVHCPHECLLVENSKERFPYNHLSVMQSLCGFCCIIREEQNPQVSKHMCYVEWNRER